MKTLIILSALLLALASCNKEMPVPDPGTETDPGYDTDPYYSDPNTPPDDSDDDDDNNDDPCSTAVHPAKTVHWGSINHH